jgi:hypothetical protein
MKLFFIKLVKSIITIFNNLERKEEKMIKIKSFSAIFAALFITCLVSNIQAQSSPVLYFCEKYTSSGEVSISDRFYTGYLTVMVKAEKDLGLRDVTIQYDKYDCRTGVFSYYKKFKFTVKPNMNYIYFEKSGENDMSFDSPGIYRVFLLDEYGSTVTSSLIEII